MECHSADNTRKAKKGLVTHWWVFLYIHHLNDNLIRYIQLTHLEWNLSQRKRYQTDCLKQSLITDTQLIQNGFFHVSRVQHMWSMKALSRTEESGYRLSYWTLLTRCLVANVTFTSSNDIVWCRVRCRSCPKAVRIQPKRVTRLQKAWTIYPDRNHANQINPSLRWESNSLTHLMSHHITTRLNIAIVYFFGLPESLKKT